MAVSAEIAPSGLSRWEPGPAHPSLARGVLDVWRAELAGVDSDVLTLLSPDEHRRARRVLNPRKGELWARSRAVLRDLLGRYLERDPHELKIFIDPSGKPRLACPPGSCEEHDPDVDFNLSHSGTLALYAFARDCSVGIDVERFGRSVDHVAIAKRVLGPCQAWKLPGLNPVEREREFLRRWVRREAAVKCAGESSEQTSAPLGVHSTPQPRPGWVSELGIGEGLSAAVAAGSKPDRVRLLTWKR